MAKKRTTIYLDENIWNTVKWVALKANMSSSMYVESILRDNLPSVGHRPWEDMPTNNKDCVV